MTTVAHSTLTGSDLHEPKGAAAASSGTVYVANGSGSGVWTAQAVPALTKIAQITFNNSSGLYLMNNCFTSTYQHYELIIDNVVTGTSNTYLFIQLGVGSSPTYETTGYIWQANYQNISNNATGAINNGANPYNAFTGALPISFPTTSSNNYCLGTTSGSTYNARVQFYNTANGNYSLVKVDCSYLSSTVVNPCFGTILGHQTVSTNVTSLRVGQATGNIIAGNATLYGYET